MIYKELPGPQFSLPLIVYKSEIQKRNRKYLSFINFENPLYLNCIKTGLKIQFNMDTKTRDITRLIYYYVTANKGLFGLLHLHISSSWVTIRLHTESQLPRLPGSV